MNEISTLIQARARAGQMLERAELTALAREIGMKPELWQHLVRHDPNERFFVQLYRDPSVDVWLICWDSAQDTGYHDHDKSAGAVYVCDGTLCEDSFFRESDGWIREHTRKHEVGGGFDFPPAHIHGLRHSGGPPWPPSPVPPPEAVRLERWSCWPPRPRWHGRPTQSAAR